jgi:diguanylate cyclase (GGDEF)-like protein/PAS domain S-box-containing protein
VTACASTLARFMAALPEPVLLLERSGIVRWANSAAQRRFGRARRRLVGRPLSEIVQDDDARVDELLKRWSRSSHPLPGRLTWVGADGTGLAVRCEGFLVPGDDAKTSLIGVRHLATEPRCATDFAALNLEVARQKQANRELRRSRAELAMERDKVTVTLYSIGDAVIATDVDGRIEHLNRVAAELTGWCEADAVGELLETVFRTITEDREEPARNPVRQCLAEDHGTERTAPIADESTLLSRDGREYVIEQSAAPIYRCGREMLGAVLVFRDITAQRLARQQLHFLAHHDPLTMLHNRYAFEQQLEDACRQAVRGGERHAMIYLDLDQFKLVNDTAGHQCGDRLLIAVARYLASRQRPGDQFSRLGGDEFAVLARDIDESTALKLAATVISGLRQQVFTGEHSEYQVGASAGVAMIDRSAQSAAEVMRKADVACYIAKRAGRGVAHLFQEDDQVALNAISEMALVNDIRSALVEGRCRLRYQPILDLATNRTAYYEILLRMRRRDGSQVSPVHLIAAAERYGFMGEVDRWVIDTALAELAAQHRNGNRITFTINLSGASLGDPGLHCFITGALERHQVPAASVIFEVTETSALARVEQAAQFMRRIRSLGCRFALDDFGTGFSSFAYLKYLPVQYLKIDGTFIRDLATDPVDQAMVRSITGIASAMGMETVAECVENRKTFASLGHYGVAFAQGFYISRPLRRPAVAAASLH